MTEQSYRKQKTFNSLIIVTTLLIFAISSSYALSPTNEHSQITNDSSKNEPRETNQLPEKYIFINLDKNTLEMHEQSKATTIINLVSQGKPGSYYETIGGVFTSAFKEPLHYSTLGHVYMPYSVHLFGNYFNHGIPYREDGTKVSTAFSGGCVRLKNEDAKRVYDFVTKETPIIISRGDIDEFSTVNKTKKKIQSSQMTKLMLAIISLEAENQDDLVYYKKENRLVSKLMFLPLFLKENDLSVHELYTKKLGEEKFVENMNKRAKTLGLSDTFFTGTKTLTETTEEDYARFMDYILTYKSYLGTL